MLFGMVNLVVRELYDRPQAAQVLSISERTLYDLEQAGEVDVVRIGRAVRITRESILRYIESLSEEAQSRKSDQRTLEFVKASARKTIREVTEIKKQAPHLAVECDELIENAIKNLEWANACSGGRPIDRKS